MGDDSLDRPQAGSYGLLSLSGCATLVALPIPRLSRSHRGGQLQTLDESDQGSGPLALARLIPSCRRCAARLHPTVYPEP